MLEDAGATVTLTMIDDAEGVVPAGFDLAVVGARIRYGRTDARVIDFARRHAATLEAMPSAYFSVNIVARKPGKDRPETNPYVGAFLRRVRWRPRRSCRAGDTRPHPGSAPGVPATGPETPVCRWRREDHPGAAIEAADGPIHG